MRQPDDVHCHRGYLSQEFGFYKSLNAYELPDYVGIMKGLGRAERRRQIHTLLEQVYLTHEARRRIGIDGEIISTPGHSDDSVTLVLDEGSAFTGDLTNPTVAEDTPDTPLTRSWDRLRAMRVTLIYPGHGPAWPL